MKVLKIPQPIEYKYSLGTPCCNEFKKYIGSFRIDNKTGKVYWEVMTRRLDRDRRPLLLDDIYWEKCPFCHDVIEILQS